MDLIERRAAIDALRDAENHAFNGYYLGLIKAHKIIAELPSAQPPVITCDGCRHVGTYDTDFPCSGCIRREKDYYEQER